MLFSAIDFHGGRGYFAAARFWMERMMPDTASLNERVKAGADGLMGLDAASF